MIILDWLQRHKKIILFVVALLAFIVMISASYLSDAVDKPVNQVISGLVTMVSEPVKKAGNGIGEISNIFRYKGLLEENERLKTQIAEMNQTIVRLKLTASQIEEFRSLSNILNYNIVKEDYDYVTCDVINSDGTNWFHTFTINAGTEHGIQKDSIVMNGDGLIGRVKDVGKNWAKVLTIIDETDSVSFRVFRNLQYIGVISGSGSGGLNGYLLDSDANIVSGDVLITSGLGIYPEGIMIGKVIEVIGDHDKLIKTITAEPSVYFKNIQRVMVLIKKG